MACCYFGEKKAQRVFANLNSTTTQKAVPPLAGQVLVEFDDGGQTSLVFRGDSKWCPRDRTVILGADGALVSDGPHLNEQSVELILPAGVCRPELETVWFDDGFDGTMSELICAIEEDRPPSHSGRNNLKTLELCFAAVASAESGQPMEVGSIARLEPAWNNLEP
jgi:predicted dehydrogenase